MPLVTGEQAHCAPKLKTQVTQSSNAERLGRPGQENLVGHFQGNEIASKEVTARILRLEAVPMICCAAACAQE